MRAYTVHNYDTGREFNGRPSKALVRQSTKHAGPTGAVRARLRVTDAAIRAALGHNGAE